MRRARLPSSSKPRTQRPARAVPERARTALRDKAQTVLQAARTIFLTHGFSAATTDMIQREAGVSKSTVYEHYPNKEALFAAVIENECAASMASVRGVGLQATGGLRETLTALARAYIGVVLGPTGLALFRVAIAEAPRFPHLAQTFYSAGPRVIRTMVAEPLARAAESGEIDVSRVGVDAAAGVFVSLVRGDAFIQYLTHPDATPSTAQLDEWVEIAVTTFLRAYGRDHRGRHR